MKRFVRIQKGFQRNVQDQTFEKSLQPSKSKDCKAFSLFSVKNQIISPKIHRMWVVFCIFYVQKRGVLSKLSLFFVSYFRYQEFPRSSCASHVSFETVTVAYNIFAPGMDLPVRTRFSISLSDI